MRSLLLAAASILVTACSANSEGPANQTPTVPAPAPGPNEGTPADTSTPRFEATACRFIVPKSAEGSTVKCGDVVVAENRAKANGRTIKIHVAVFPGKKELPPIFELIGGPGGGADPNVGLLAAHEKSMMSDSGFLLTRGDYVIFDQRGIGRSEPNLACAEEEVTRSSSMLDVMTKCRDRLVGQGIDLGAYTTYDNALDVDDIRKVLGYDKIDLHSISYGTLLALEVMRQKPEHIHSVIVDGVLPPEAKLISDTPRTIDEDLTRIFTACSKDGACNAAFPDLDGSLATLEQKLDEKPFDSEMGPFDFYAFTGMLGQSMYEPDGIRQIPLWVHDFATRGQAGFDDWVKSDPSMNAPPPPNDNPLATEVFDALDKLQADELASLKYLDINEGMFTSVTCSDSGQYETEADADAELAKIRPMMQDIEREDIKEQLAICAMWPKSEKRATTKQAVTSSIPTLSLGGEFDPVTPSYWAEQVTKTLANGQFIFQKALGHGSMDACAQSIKLAFFGDSSAKPDATCAGARAMKFVTSWQEAAQASSFHSVKRVTRPITRPIASRPIWITGR